MKSNKTPSKYIKSQGLPTLAYVERETGVSARTLRNWYHDKNKLFEVVIAGVKARSDGFVIMRKDVAIHALGAEWAYEKEK